jgi:hypothetical protein
LLQWGLMMAGKWKWIHRPV